MSDHRLVLEGVPRVGYDIHCCPLAGCLVSAMEYLGDPVDYDLVMGAIGAPFRRLWNRDDGGNIDLMYFTPEPHQRASKAIGREIRTVERDRAAILQALKESLVRGAPAIAFGVVGPPEASLIAGYDEDGDVLIGWSYFQDRSKPGYFEKADWFNGMDPGGTCGLLTIGDKQDVPKADARELFVSSLKWAVHLERMNRLDCFPDHVAGLAACKAWADALEVDADYPADDKATMELRLMVHGDQCTMLWERFNAAAYLRKSLDLAPEAKSELTAASELFDRTAKQGEGLWPWSCDMSDPKALAGLAESNVRRPMAARVRELARLEEQAVEQLEKALAAMGEGL